MNKQSALSGVYRVLIAGLLALTSLPLSAQGLGNLNPPAGPIAPVGKDLDKVNPRIPISSLPFTVNKCGSYFLTNCLTGVAGSNGITIQADDVTLDLNGFTLTGVPGSLNGVNVDGGWENITIEGSGVLDSWGADGIFCTTPNPVTVRSVYSTNNGGCGYRLTSGRILLCESRNNILHGFCWSDSTGLSRLENCRATGNGGDGINWTLSAAPSPRNSYSWHCSDCYSAYNSGRGCSIEVQRPNISVTCYSNRSSYCDNAGDGYRCQLFPGATNSRCNLIMSDGHTSRNGGSGMSFQSDANSSSMRYQGNRLFCSGNAVHGSTLLFTGGSKLEFTVHTMKWSDNGSQNCRIDCSGASSCDAQYYNSSSSGAGGDGLHLICGSTSSCRHSLYNSSLSGNTGNGATITTGGSPTSLHLQGCILDSNGQDGAAATGGNLSMTCYGSNYRRNAATGLRYAGSGSVYCKECTFSDSTTGSDVFCSAGQCQAKFSYCTFNNCTTGSSTTCTGGSTCSSTYEYCGYADNSTAHCTSNCTNGGSYSQVCTDCRCTGGGRGYENLCTGGRMTCVYNRCHANRCTYGCYNSTENTTAPCYLTKSDCTYTDCSQDGCHATSRNSTCYYRYRTLTCSGCTTGYRWSSTGGGRSYCSNYQCVATNNASHGAYCTSSSGSRYQYQCRECKFDSNGGDGCRSEGAGTYRCVECVATENQGNGYSCSGADRMNCDRCTSSDNNGVGQLCEGAGRCVLSVPKYSGNNDGAAVVGTQTTEVEGGSISNNNGAAINAVGAGPGKVSVKGTRMTGNPGGNLHVPNPPSVMVLLYRCVVQGPPVQGAPAPGSDVAPVSNPSGAGPNDNINCP